MSGINRTCQKINSYRIGIRGKRWRRLFTWLLDVTVHYFRKLFRLYNTSSTQAITIFVVWFNDSKKSNARWYDFVFIYHRNTFISTVLGVRTFEKTLGIFYSEVGTSVTGWNNRFDMVGRLLRSHCCIKSKHHAWKVLERRNVQEPGLTCLENKCQRQILAMLWIGWSINLNQQQSSVSHFNVQCLRTRMKPNMNNILFTLKTILTIIIWNSPSTVYSSILIHQIEVAENRFCLKSSNFEAFPATKFLPLQPLTLKQVWIDWWQYLWSGVIL